MATMSAKQYRALLDQLGISQMAMARLLQIGPRTSRRYADRGIDFAPAAILLWLLADGTITPEDIEAIYERKPPRR